MHGHTTIMNTSGSSAANILPAATMMAATWVQEDSHIFVLLLLSPSIFRGPYPGRFCSRLFRYESDALSSFLPGPSPA